MSYNVTRRAFVPSDLFRRYFYLSRSVGGMIPAPTPEIPEPAHPVVELRPVSGADVECEVGYADPLPSNGSLADWVVRCVVPLGTAVGTYTLRVNGVSTGLAMTVLAAPAAQDRQSVGPIPGWSGPAQAALTGGKELHLQPGRYVLDGILSFPAGGRLAGNGATVALSPGATFQTPNGATPAAVTITDLTIESADPYDLASVVTASVVPADAVFARCTFRDVVVGPAAVLTRCRLEQVYWNMDGAGGPKLAERLVVLLAKGKEVEAVAVPECEGLFAAALPKRQDYRLRAEGHGAVWEFDDPFRFGPVLGEMDEYLLGEGTHRRLWQVLHNAPVNLALNHQNLVDHLWSDIQDLPEDGDRKSVV